MTARSVAKLALAVLSVGFAFAAVEVALRIAGVDYNPIQVEDRRDDRTHHVFDDDSFVYDPLLIWKPRPASGVFNRQGFRGREVETGKEAGEVRIATVGDSNTLGWQGVSGPHWPGDLETLLSRKDSEATYTVLNAGVWGYSSHQGVERLRGMLAYSPDLVLISFGSNDAHPTPVPDAAYAGGKARGLRLTRGLSRLRVGRLLAGAASGFAARPGEASEPTHRVPLADYEKNLREMLLLARDARALPVLLTRPYLDSVPEPPRWKNYAPAYNAATAEVAAREGAPLIDLYTHFKAKREYFADESHFTDRGHEIAAAIVLEKLLPLLDDIGLPH